ncbi:hypothetical protein BN1232_01329 [Mycobacterium lentiflavum]|uniref:Uncharacterized protein n=1 Tax=Mycobacterium lentiflavum TaxID=141349 RepID=A0A0E4CM02_MYCLN|nr:hypothetical protein BN1232_01329 [Mycobacterium lentiflavum]
MLWLLNLVITRGTPPRLEGCRPASRGLMLALMTNTKTILLSRPDANGQVDICSNTLDNVGKDNAEPPKI